MGAVRESRVKVLPGHTDVLLRSVDVVRLLMRRDPTLTGTVRQRFAAAMTALKQLEQTKTVETVVKAAPVQPMPEPVVEQAAQQPEPGAGQGEEMRPLRNGKSFVSAVIGWNGCSTSSANWSSVVGGSSSVSVSWSSCRSKSWLAKCD